MTRSKELWQENVPNSTQYREIFPNSLKMNENCPDLGGKEREHMFEEEKTEEVAEEEVAEEATEGEE